LDKPDASRQRSSLILGSGAFAFMNALSLLTPARPVLERG
jgi:hypothetical protein